MEREREARQELGDLIGEQRFPMLAAHRGGARPRAIAEHREVDVRNHRPS